MLPVKAGVGAASGAEAGDAAEAAAWFLGEELVAHDAEVLARGSLKNGDVRAILQPRGRCPMQVG